MQDSETNTRANSVTGEALDHRRKRGEASELRKNVLGKKHDKLGESKAGRVSTFIYFNPVLTP